jgi:hypothetical protein
MPEALLGIVANAGACPRCWIASQAVSGITGEEAIDTELTTIVSF